MAVKYLDKKWINLIMTGYFSLIGVGSMFEFFAKMATNVLGKISGDFHLSFAMKDKSSFLIY